ncbi:MAG: FAD-dependent oxidoreductase, partial [Desulfobacterales bacterium]
MQHIEEPSRAIPVLAETDILVVGSGPGGLSASLAGAREGMETILVERYGCFGGNITQAGVESIAWYRHEKTVDAGGIGAEFEHRAEEIGGRRKEPQSLSQALDTELFKYVADTIVQEAGIVPILHCYGVQAVMEGNTIRGVIVEGKSGRQAILAKRIIDATGDADIAHLAGAPYRQSPKDALLGVTVTFGCSGVDVPRFREYVNQNSAHLGDWDELEESTGKENDLFSPYIEEPFNKAKDAGEIPRDAWIKGTWSSLTEAGEATYLNLVVLNGIDPTDVRDLTKAEMQGRQQVLWALDALKKYTPGFEKARLRTFCSSLGTRESRKIIGEYNITEQDVRNEARFEDSIGIFPEFLDGYGVVIIPTTGRYFQVPYGIILPRKVENLLVAGRCVAGDKISHAATRQMMCCTVTGQGAGIAAAVSLKDNVTCREVKIATVQKILNK